MPAGRPKRTYKPGSKRKRCQTSIFADTLEKLRLVAAHDQRDLAPTLDVIVAEALRRRKINVTETLEAGDDEGAGTQ